MKEKLARAAAIDAEREAKIRKEEDDDDEDDEVKMTNRKRSFSAVGFHSNDIKSEPTTPKKVGAENDKTHSKKHSVIDLCNDVSSDDSNDSKGDYSCLSYPFLSLRMKFKILSFQT